jgi:hypothetical protein
MNAIKRFLFKTGSTVAAIGLLALIFSLFAGITPVAAAALPPSTCTLVGSTRTCDLYAKTGTALMPDGSSVNIWGYSDTAGGAATLPGPTLIANAGETLVVNLHNGLAEASSLSFPMSNLAPDTTGAAAGSTATYTFQVSSPGTFIYQAGLTANIDHQVAMGLYGALIVRPAVISQAYDANSVFVDEAVLVFSEVDPALNAAPTTFDMRAFKPKYWLVNGQSAPSLPEIASAAGNPVLLRYVNAGLLEHNLSLLGVTQKIVGISGVMENFPYSVSNESLGTGMTLDTIVTVPAGAVAGTKYALYDRGLHLDNGATALANSSSQIGLGGMLTYITAVTGAAAPAVLPVTTAVTVTPVIAAASGTANLTATITIAGGGALTAAEYHLDSLAGPAVSIPAGASPLSVNVSVLLTGLTSGDHAIYVRGQNANGWGPAGSAVINIVANGPIVSGIILTPPNTNGTVNVSIQATASDTLIGKTNVTAAEYFIDAAGANGAGTALTLNGVAQTVALTGTIPAAQVAALAEGPHSIFINAQDAFGNWGGFEQAILIVDKTGPNVESLAVTPNPNNGQIPVNATIGAVEISGLFSDPVIASVNSKVVQAEAFIDTAGVSGQGIPLVSRTALFDATTVPGYADIPLPTIAQLSNGQHPLWVHAKDAAGNWGPLVQTTLFVDKQGPNLAAPVTNPLVVFMGMPFNLLTTATDPANTNTFGSTPLSNVVYAEYFLSNPSFGAAVPLTGTFTSPSVALTATITPTRAKGWVLGNNTVFIRSRDALGNWGPTISVVLQVKSGLFLPLMKR